MRRLSLISIMIVLVCGLIFSSCAQPAPAPAPTPTPAPTPAPAPAPAPAPTPTPTPAPAPAPAATIKLRLTVPGPPVDTYSQKVWIPWSAMIKERTTAIGKPVEVVFYPSQSLVKHADQYQAVITGIADIAGNIVTDDFVPGGGLLSVMELPLMFASGAGIGRVAQELFDTGTELRNETAKVKLLWFQPVPPGQLFSRKPIKTVADFKGIKIRANRATAMDIVKQLGGVPLDMMIPEIYVSLERGILDAVSLSPQAILPWKHHEVTQYRTFFPRGIYIDFLSVIMNWDTWNSLPPDVQKIFEELSGAYMTQLTGEAVDAADVSCGAVIQAYDKKVGNPEWYYVPEDEFQEWRAAIMPVYDMWIKRMEAKGLPGKAFLEKVQSLAEKYSK